MSQHKGSLRGNSAPEFQTAFFGFPDLQDSSFLVSLWIRWDLSRWLKWIFISSRRDQASAASIVITLKGLHSHSEPPLLFVNICFLWPIVYLQKQLMLISYRYYQYRVWSILQQKLCGIYFGMIRFSMVTKSFK